MQAQEPTTAPSEAPLQEFSWIKRTIKIKRVSGVLMILLFGLFGCLNFFMWLTEAQPGDDSGLIIALVSLPFCVFGILAGRFYTSPDVQCFSGHFTSRFWLRRTYQYRDIAGFALYWVKKRDGSPLCTLVARFRSGKTKRILVPGLFEQPRELVAALQNHSGHQSAVCQTKAEFKKWRDTTML